MVVKISNSRGLASDMPRFCEALQSLKKFGVFCLCFIFLWFQISLSQTTIKRVKHWGDALIFFHYFGCLKWLCYNKDNQFKFFCYASQCLKKCLVSWYELQNADIKFKQSSQSYRKSFHKRGTWDYCWRMLQPELPGYNRWSMILLYFVLIELQFQD